MSVITKIPRKLKKQLKLQIVLGTAFKTKEARITGISYDIRYRKRKRTITYNNVSVVGYTLGL